MQVTSELELAGRACAQTSGRGNDCLGWSVVSEVQRLRDVYGVKWPDGFPESGCAFRAWVWTHVKENALRWGDDVRRHFDCDHELGKRAKADSMSSQTLCTRMTAKIGGVGANKRSTRFMGTFELSVAASVLAAVQWA